MKPPNDVAYWVMQGIWSERDQAYGFRFWDSHLEKKVAIRTARKLSHARVFRVECVWETQDADEPAASTRASPQ